MVCVMRSLFVQWNVSPMSPVAVVGSNPAETPTIEMSTVAARASPAINRKSDAPSTSAIDRRIRAPLFGLGEVYGRRIAPDGPVSCGPWRTS